MYKQHCILTLNTLCRAVCGVAYMYPFAPLVYPFARLLHLFARLLYPFARLLYPFSCKWSDQNLKPFT